MDTPLDRLVCAIVKLLDVDLHEEFEERAGIMQFDGQLSRNHAEYQALLDVLHRHKLKLIAIK